MTMKIMNMPVLRKIINHNYSSRKIVFSSMHHLAVQVTRNQSAESTEIKIVHIVYTQVCRSICINYACIMLSDCGASAGADRINQLHLVE